MSRTDIHRPIWVQEKDPTVRHWFKDHHDHTNGICDLEENLDKQWLYNPTQNRNCYRTPWSQCPCLCGCDLCTGRQWDRQRRRRERHQWRKLSSELAKWNKNDLSDAEWQVVQHLAW